MADFTLEDQHEGPVCGLDEVGRGPLAGPVVAACVIIPKEKRNLDFIQDIKDSKKLSPKKREELYKKITEHFPHAISELSPQEIDELNILQASLEAMRRAFLEAVSFLRKQESNSLNLHALIDGNKAPNLPCPLTTVIKGDSKSKSIAAASIIAKVHRDSIMQNLAKEFPEYGWDKNSGYPTAQHRKALLNHGITEHHRRSFSPVSTLLSYSLRHVK